MHEGGGSTRPRRVTAPLGSGLSDGPSSRGDLVDPRARPRSTAARMLASTPTGPSVFRHGDLLEGIVAAVALLVMVAIGVTPWLAIPLATVTYLGVALLRPPRERQDGTVADADPALLAGGATVDDTGPGLPVDATAPANADAVAARFGLTRREREILPLLVQRLTDREIAERLCISHRTAMNHVASILGKLGLASRRDVAAFLATEQR